MKPLAFWSFMLSCWLMLAAVVTARAHEAPSGWEYPIECCSNRDCDIVTQHGERDGMRTMTTKRHGEIVIYPDQWQGIRPSADKEWHICTRPDADGVPGMPRRHIYCIFAPGGV